MKEIFVARQPIFDTRHNVYGYEIFYRGSEVNAFDNTQGDIATAETLMNTFLTFGLSNLTHDKPAFINFDERFIVEEIALLFPSNNLVIEMPPSVEPGAVILERCQALRRKGYRIAASDFVLQPGYEGLLETVSIVKLDFKKPGPEAVRKLMLNSRRLPHLQFLAEKVETYDEFECARKIGCTLFQGYYFGKPVMHRTQTLQSLEITYFSVMNAVNSQEIDFNELSKIILRDMSLTYYLLKLVNAPAFGLLSRVTSVKQALVVLGEREIQKWFSMIVLHIIGKEKPHELIRTSLCRARMAELLARKSPLKANAEHFFLAGLFSMLDALLDRPFAQIIQEIYLPESVKKYLLGEESLVSPIMDLVIAYEQGSWTEVVTMTSQLRLGSGDLIAAYRDALKWLCEMNLD